VGIEEAVATSVGVAIGALVGTAVSGGGAFGSRVGDGGDGSGEPGDETSHHVEGYNVSDLGSIVFSLLKQEIQNQR